MRFLHIVFKNLTRIAILVRGVLFLVSKQLETLIKTDLSQIAYVKMGGINKSIGWRWVYDYG